MRLRRRQRDDIQLAFTAAALVLSGISALFAWNANNISSDSLRKQFTTDYSVSCSYDGDYDFTTYGRLFIGIPVKCSIANLSNRTITVSKIDGAYNQKVEGNRQKLVASVDIAGIEDDQKKPIKGDYGDVNLPIAQGQKVDITFEARYWTTDNFLNYLQCNGSIDSQTDAPTCRLKYDQDYKSEPEAWEKVINSYRDSTLNGKEDTDTVFTFTTTDNVAKSSGDLCFPLRICDWSF